MHAAMNYDDQVVPCMHGNRAFDNVAARVPVAWPSEWGRLHCKLRDACHQTGGIPSGPDEVAVRSVLIADGSTWDVHCRYPKGDCVFRCYSVEPAGQWLADWTVDRMPEVADGVLPMTAAMLVDGVEVKAWKVALQQVC